MTGTGLVHEDVGSGDPAVMLIHGFASGIEDWAAQQRHLSARHRVVSVALRGHGVSERGDAAMTMEQAAADCLGLLKAKGIARAVLAGHSMGTRIALEAHRQAPETVVGLILVDGSNATAIADLETARDGFRKTIAEKGYSGFAEPLFAQMFYDPKFDELKARYIARALKVHAENGLAHYESLITWDGTVARQAISEAAAPILVIQSTTRDASGGRRTLEPGEVGAYESLVKEHAPGADIVAMPGLGHYTMIEAPEAVNASIDQWLDSHALRK